MMWYRPFCKSDFYRQAAWLYGATATINLFAATDGHATGHAWQALLFKCLNIGVIGYVLWTIARKHLPGFLNKRSDDIAVAIAQAQAKEKEAHDLLREYDKKLSEMGKFIETSMAEARKNAEAEKQRIITEAQREADEIIASAQRSANAMGLRLKQEVERRTLEKALLSAEEKITAHLQSDKRNQQMIVEHFIEEVRHAE